MSTTDSKNLVYPHFNDPPVLPELNPAAAVPASLSSAGSSKLIENVSFLTPNAQNGQNCIKIDFAHNAILQNGTF